MKVFSKLIELILRFPLTISCFVGTFFVAIRLERSCEFWENLDETALEEIFPFLLIGFFLMLSIELYSERKKINSAYLAFPVVLLIWVYFLYQLKNPFEIKNNRIDPNFLLFIASFFLSLILLFTAKKSKEKFWQYSRKLFARFVFTFLIAIILYQVSVFLSQIIADPIYFYLDFLYLYLPDFSESYSQIAMFIAMTWGILFFLSGIPRASKIPHLNRIKHY